MLHAPSAGDGHSSEHPLVDRASLANGTKGEKENGVSRLHLATTKLSFDDQSTTSAESVADEDILPLPVKKRRRIARPDDIEGAYLKRLLDQEARIQSQTAAGGRLSSPSHADATVPKGSAEQAASEASGAGDYEQIPQHETLGGLPVADASDKSDRTVFLGNVSIEAIKSKSARKTLLDHLTACLSTLQSTAALHKVESLRFRSTAFVSGVGPKRAAYAKRELMEETTHSTNAYAVYTTQAAAKKAASSLNGTVVLDRHLRTDLVGSPAEIDHKRCVFVGNLSFVDEEMVETETEGGIKERKKRGKQPADAEEGLWRTFSKAGRVESVRVIRDKSTRIGKGIAYVQYYDENGVEAALLYNDKRFPPLLPRTLRVTRARRPKKASEPSSRPKDSSISSSRPGGRRPSSETKRALATQGVRSRQSGKGKSFVFEGHRATKPVAHTAKDGTKRRKHAAKPTTRSSRRGSAFKAAGGKRQRV